VTHPNDPLNANARVLIERRVDHGASFGLDRPFLVIKGLQHGHETATIAYVDFYVISVL